MPINSVNANGFQKLDGVMTLPLDKQPKQEPIGGKADLGELKNPRFDISDIRLTPGQHVYSATLNTPKEEPLPANIIDNTKEHEARALMQKQVNKDGSYVVYDRYGKEINRGTRVDPDYDGFEKESNQGYGDRYFFDAHTNFLTDAAKEYATISDDKDFKYCPTQDGSFIASTLDFFTNGKETKEDETAMHNQVQTMVRELADRVKNGQSTDLRTLNTKITIEGQDLTMGQIMDIQSASKKLTKDIDDIGSGSESIPNYMKKALTKVAANLYANTLPGKLGQAYKTAFSNIVDSNYNASQNNFNQYSSYEPVFVKNNNAAVASYNLFSSIDTSSKANATADFEKKMNSFDEILQNYNQSVQGYAPVQQYETETRDYFNSILNSIPD